MPKNEQVKSAGAAAPRNSWEPPSVKRVGHVGEIFQFPGGAKLSTAADDTGDVPRKPTGQEDK